MMDSDYQAALELSKKINSNPRRTLKAIQDPSTPTPAARRINPAKGSQVESTAVTNQVGAAQDLQPKSVDSNRRVTRSSKNIGEAADGLIMASAFGTPLKTSVAGSDNLPITPPSSVDDPSVTTISTTPDSNPIDGSSTFLLTPPEAVNDFYTAANAATNGHWVHFSAQAPALTPAIPKVTGFPDLHKACGSATDSVTTPEAVDSPCIATASDIQDAAATNDFASLPAMKPTDAVSDLHTPAASAFMHSFAINSGPILPTSLEVIVAISEASNAGPLESFITIPPTVVAGLVDDLPVVDAMEVDSTGESAIMAAQYLYTTSVSSSDSAPAACQISFTVEVTDAASILVQVANDTQNIAPPYNSGSCSFDTPQHEHAVGNSVVPGRSHTMVTANALVESELTQDGRPSSGSARRAFLDLLADAAEAEILNGLFEPQGPLKPAEGPASSCLQMVDVATQDDTMMSETSSPLSSPPLSPMQDIDFDEEFNASSSRIDLSTLSHRETRARILNVNAATLFPPLSKKRLIEDPSPSNVKRVKTDVVKTDVVKTDVATQQEPGIKINRSKQPKIAATRALLYNVNEQLDKPEPIGRPLVWADKRQQLCETLHYYRAYQSGAYTHDGVLLGFLVNKEVDIRDVFNHHIIITTTGGGRSVDESGKRGRLQDQVENAVTKACTNSKNRGVPVALIAGQGNCICPSQLPHYFNVLDWFQVTDVWCEMNDGVKVWMVRFEKISLDTESWWVSASSLKISTSSYLRPKSPEASCSFCQVSSKQIYTRGWVCLNPDCDTFFQIEGVLLTDNDAQYTADYLLERTSFPGSSPGPLAPPLLTDEDVQSKDLFGVEERCKKGIVCPMCGCCSRRIEWTQWRCENKHCDFIHSITQRPVPIEAAIAHTQGFKPKNKAPAKLVHHPLIRSQEEVIGRYEVIRYAVPGPEGETIGQILHLKANDIINQQPDGPNDLFHDMQGQDFGLRRNPSRQKDRPSEILTSHWATNFGAPYKFGVATLSRPFAEAKAVIIKTVKRLTWAGHQALSGSGEVFQNFNELLALGYFEDTEIGYHDDGEKELGPTVASLSLGASATMSWRPKVKSGIGAESKNAKGTKNPMLKITLKHGDIMVMHGAKIQQYYEHAVTPHGMLRFALTCRCIRPELMATEEDREHTITAGTLPAWADQYQYDGDIKVGVVGDVNTQMGEVETS